MDLDLKIYLHPPVSFADTEILIIRDCGSNLYVGMRVVEMF